VRLIALTHLRVHTVCGEDEIGIECFGIGDVALEAELRPDGLAAIGQDLEQRAAGQPGEAMAGRSECLAVVVDLDVVPAVALLRHRRSDFGIGIAQRILGGVREHDAEAKGVLEPVALVDHHLVTRVRALHERGEEQSRGSTADARDLHGAQAITQAVSPPIRSAA